MTGTESAGNLSNPYLADLRLRRAFEEGRVSRFENEVNEPLFLDMLPKGPRVRRVLDMGCGPGGSHALSHAYPDPAVEIIGLDLPEMLPEPGYRRVKFAGWRGPEGLNKDGRRALVARIGRFDVIAMKMFAHYCDMDDLARITSDLLAKNGSVALSIPHPEGTAQYLGTDPDSLLGNKEYVREIGATGIKARMIYCPTRWWIGISGAFTYRLPSNYRRVVQEPTDEFGVKRRLNILFRPPTRRERTIDALQWLAAWGTSEGEWPNPKRIIRIGTT